MKQQPLSPLAHALSTAAGMECRGGLLAHVVSGIWRQMNGQLSSDVLRDCEAEAALALWQAREKLAAVPEDKRPAYAVVCVRRAVREVLRRELRQRRGTTSLEEADLDERCARPADEPAVEWAALARDTLIQQISHAALAEAIRALPPRDYAILDLYYARGFPDAEIARRLRLLPDTVKKRRGRMIAALRRTLRGSSPGS